MKRMAFFLKKGNKKMSQFYQSQLELQEDHKDKLAKEGYSVGVMQFSHTETATERKYVTCYVDSRNKDDLYSKRNFFGEREDGEIPEVGDYIVKAQERDVSLFGRSRVRVPRGTKFEIIGQVTKEMVLQRQKEKQNRIYEMFKKAEQKDGSLLFYTGTFGRELYGERLSFNAQIEETVISRYGFTVDREAVRVRCEETGIIEVEYFDSVKFL